MKGSITKRSKGRRGPSTWQLKWDLPALPGRRKFGYKTVVGTRDHAQEELRKIVTSLGDGSYVTPSDLTFSEWAEQWLSALDVSGRTREGYATLLRNHLVPELGGRQLQKLTAGDLEDLYAKLRVGDNGLSPRTVLHIHRATHTCLEKARRRRLVAVNVARDAVPPRVQQEFDTTRLPSVERVQSFLEQLEQPADATRRRWRMTADCRVFVRDLASLALMTGMRRGELLALRWTDVNLNTGLISVARSIEQSKTGLRLKAPKSGKPRTVAIPQSVCTQLRSMQKRQKELWLAVGVRPGLETEALLFPASPDAPEALMKPAAASARFREAADAFGLSLHLHDLRHLHVSVMLKELTAAEVSRRAGHANPAVTLRLYAHALPDTEQRQAQAVDTLLIQRR
jgi:integrase